MSTLPAVVTVMDADSGPAVVVRDGGYPVVPEPHRYPLVWKPPENETLARDLKLVDRSYHVDSVVDDVRDGRVDFTVESHQAKVTQVQLLGTLNRDYIIVMSSTITSVITVF